MRRHALSLIGAPLDRGALHLDPQCLAVTWEGKPVPRLTLSEFILLYELARHPGHILTRDQLIEAIYGDREEPEAPDDAIASHVKRIRSKARPAGLDALETVSGVGFRLVAAKLNPLSNGDLP